MLVVSVRTQEAKFLINKSERKMSNFVRPLFVLFFIITSVAFSQNITNTLGTSGVFSVKDNTNTFFSISQTNGTLSLISLSAGSQRGSIFKGSDRFLHTYYGTGTNGYNTFLGVNAGNFSMGGTSADEGSMNTVVGNSSFSSNTTGYQNAAFGFQSMNQNTTGSFNSAFGSYSYYWNTSGSSNSAFGSASLFYNTTGGENSAFGASALFNNSSGSTNSAFGTYALYSNTTGNDNSAYGVQSLYQNTTGYRNSAFGRNALRNNINGIANSSFGYESLPANTTGTRNSSFGAFSLYSNTEGGFNSAFGGSALFYNTTGEHNSAFGFSALFYNTGSYNTAFGYHALLNNTSGQNNAGFGYSSLYSSTGSNNTALGTYAGNSITTGSNNIVIGYNAQVPSASGDNQVTIGNSSISYAGIQVAWTITSDKRWKENIRTSSLGLDFITQLRPVSYSRNNDESKRVEFGLLAQDVEEVLQKFNIDNTGMLTIDESGYYHLRYNDLLAPMIKAIQELKSENEVLKEKNNKLMTELKSENEALKIKLESFEKIQEQLIKAIENINKEKSDDVNTTMSLMK